MKIVAMFAVLLWGGCAHASGMVQAITAIECVLSGTGTFWLMVECWTQ